MAKEINTKSNSLSGDLLKKLFMSEYFILVLSLVMFVIVWFINPNIGSPRSLMSMLQNLLPLFIIAVGQMYVLLLGGIDLSQPSIIGITSVLGAIFLTNSCDENRLGDSVLWGTVIGPDGGPMANSPYAVPVAILVMLAVGILIGFTNGWFISTFNMPPFMVTLVMQGLFLYIGLWLTRSFNIVGLPDGFINIGRGSLFGLIPYALFIALAVGLLASFILNKTILGKWLYASGENARAAEISGVPIKRVVIIAYVVSGLCCAIASIIYSGRLQQGCPTLSSFMLMDVIGATVIGGTSMFGGKGKVSWVLIGCIFFSLLSGVLDMLRLSAFIVNIIKGLVILMAALLDVIRTRIFESSQVVRL